MSLDEMRVSLDELQRLSQSHVPMTMITAAEGEMPLEEFLANITPGTTINTRTVQVCRECFMGTNTLITSVWPCTVAKLLARNTEMTRHVHDLWAPVSALAKLGKLPPVRANDLRMQYEHLGLHVDA